MPWLVGTAEEVTFHRAIDMASDLERALEDVIACGVQRVLTSGGASSAWEGRKRLQAMVRQAPLGRRLLLAVACGLRDLPADGQHRRDGISLLHAA